MFDNIDWFGVLDLGLGFGVVIAWAVWELWSLRRSQRRDREAEAQKLTQSSIKPDDAPPPA